MAKIEIEVEVNEEGLLGALTAVKETQRKLNMEIAALESAITGKYSNFKNKAEAKEKPGTIAPGKEN